MPKRIRELEKMLEIARRALCEIRLKINRNWVIDVEEISAIIGHISQVLVGNDPSEGDGGDGGKEWHEAYDADEGVPI